MATGLRMPDPSFPAVGLRPPGTSSSLGLQGPSSGFWSTRGPNSQDFGVNNSILGPLGSLVGGLVSSSGSDQFTEQQREQYRRLFEIYETFARTLLESADQFSKPAALADAAQLSQGFLTSAVADFEKKMPKLGLKQAASGAYSNTAIQNLGNELASQAAAATAGRQSELTAKLINDYRALLNQAFAASAGPVRPAPMNPGTPTAEEDVFGSLIGSALPVVGRIFGLPF